MKKSDFDQIAIAKHKKFRGKVELKLKTPLKTRNDLSWAYTPGVAAVSSAIRADQSRVNELTNRGNTIAIVSDGSAVLGLGNIGPMAGLPVMEGKAAIFKSFGNVDAIPLCINACAVDDIVRFCRQLEPSVAGINLEDIAAPRCFEILERLEAEATIPVFHDDQDGTAIVVLAALLNALVLTKRSLKTARIVINGAGAAGIATARLLIEVGAADLIILDSVGTIYHGRDDLNTFKLKLALATNRDLVKGRLETALARADVFIGVSKADLLTEAMVRSMAASPIIFALANPDPEIRPEIALKAGAGVVGTGRSDFPNQINNALVFPGLFRGLLDSGARSVTTGMKLGAAKALSGIIKPTIKRLLPDLLDRRTVKVIRAAVIKASRLDGGR